MRIINIMQDVRPVNMGIKEAATNTCSILFSKFNVSTELWFYGSDYKNLFHTAIPVPLESRSIACLKKKMQDRNLNSDTDIIITHGPWNYQSIWGSFLAKKNFKWIFVPHGTLEPCGISQKWLKKKIYYSLLEKRMLSGTSVIRAISTPEKQNLHQRFPGKEIVLIPNGFDASKNIISTTEREKRIFLFMARLHPQKGIVPLLKAWLQSSLNNDESFFLAIAGPDEGELNKMTPLIKQSANIKYLGLIHKEAKTEWLNKSTFFILPSRCEGFSLSLLETAASGLIPVITESCNFPEILNQHLAIKTNTNENEIRASLEYCKNLPKQQLNKYSIDLSNYIKKNYNLDTIAQKQYDLYCSLLNK